jgi:uncharacterized protein YhdP
MLLKLFKFLKEKKQIICNKLIVKLDKIINKCSSKNDKLIVEQLLDEAEDIKQFSKKFYENKEILKLSIDELRVQNDNYKTILHGLFIHYKNNNEKEILKIFKLLGYEITKELR